MSRSPSLREVLRDRAQTDSPKPNHIEHSGHTAVTAVGEIIGSLDSQAEMTMPSRILEIKNAKDRHNEATRYFFVTVARGSLFPRNDEGGRRDMSKFMKQHFGLSVVFHHDLDFERFVEELGEYLCGEKKAVAGKNGNGHLR